MKTLLIFSHDNAKRSKAGMSLVKSAQNNNIDTHIISESYPDEDINTQAEVELLAKYDKIVLLFPMYWLNCNYLTKKWIDTVVSYYYQNSDNMASFASKEVGIVTTYGSNVFNDAKPGKRSLSISDGRTIEVSSVTEYYNSIIDSFLYINAKIANPSVLAIHANNVNNPKEVESFLNYIK